MVAVKIKVTKGGKKESRLWNVHVQHELGQGRGFLHFAKYKEHVLRAYTL